MTPFFSVLTLLVGCSGETGVSGVPEVEEIEQLPVLVVTNPERGAFLPPGEVRIRGQATKGEAALKSLVANGIDINLEANGEFAQVLPVQIGLNLLGSRLEDLAGKRAVDGRSFYWGDSYFPGEFVEQGLRMRLGPELLDDNNPDINDAATLVEMAATDPDLADLIIGTTIEDDNYTFIITDLEIDDADVDIVPNRAYLSIQVDLHDFWMSFDVNDIFGWDYLDTDGSAWADTVTLSMDVAMAMSNGQVESTTTQAQTSLNGFGLTVNNFPDSLEGYLADWVQDYIQEAAAEALKDQVGNLLVQFIEGLSADTTIGDIEIYTQLNAVEIRKSGILLTADVACEGADLSQLPSGAGSPKTDSDPPNWSALPDQPFAIAVDDDLLNQFFFSYWATGAMSGFDFSGTELALLAGAPIEAPLGPVSSANIRLSLPPMLRKGTQPEMTADMGIGELRFVVARQDGQIHDFSVSAWVGAIASLSESGKVSLEFDSRPKYIPMEIGVLDWDPNLDPGDLAALVRLMMPPLFGRASSLAPSFDVPSIPLGDSLNLSSLEGLELSIRDATFTLNDDNWLILGASVVGTQ
jgi:hypothetical protein